MSSEQLNIPSPEQIFLLPLDPVHIGTGGMRLGRVDNTIVREPGTRLPKIPGTSLSGAIRQYAAQRFGKLGCAGQGGHCGRPTCPICYTFGYVTASGRSTAGVVSIGDARILLFPVYSMCGPVWVTCPSALHDSGVCESIPSLSFKSRAIWKKEITAQQHINLGWLMLEREEEAFAVQLTGAIPDEIQNRVVLVADSIYSQIVNSNLEVRTSVSIDPETGAASKGALFTYEAIPRATVLWMDVITDDFRQSFPDPDKLQEWQRMLMEPDLKKIAQKELLWKWKLLDSQNDSPEKFQEAVIKAGEWIVYDQSCYNNNLKAKGWDGNGTNVPLDVVCSGLDWAEHLGIGGMGTRGFGRIRHLQETIVHEEAIND